MNMKAIGESKTIISVTNQQIDEILNKGVDAKKFYMELEGVDYLWPVFRNTSVVVDEENECLEITSQIEVTVSAGSKEDALSYMNEFNSHLFELDKSYIFLNNDAMIERDSDTCIRWTSATIFTGTLGDAHVVEVNFDHVLN